MTANKLLAALVGTLALGLQQYLDDGRLSGVEWVLLVGMLLTALGAWLVPNTPALTAAKTWTAALVIGAGVLAPLLADGLQQADIWPTLIAVLTAAGVWAAPNKIPDPSPAG